MRIVQFIDTLRSGGKERQLVELLKGLSREKEIECHLIVMSETTHYTDLYKLDIPVHRLVRTSKKDPRIFLWLYALLKQIRPDILHSWSSMCSVYALPAVKLLKIKFINGFLRSAPPWRGLGDKEWQRSKLTFPFSDVIVANSKAGLLTYKAPVQKSKYIHNGFDFSRLRHLESPDIVRNRHGITTQYVVGMVATFSDKKDFSTFINAAQNILEKRQDITFLAVGDGPYLPRFQEYVQKKNKPFIIFPGKIQKVESLVRVFDIGVLVSNAKIHGEGISNTIMEYMALGKPVIATDCGGNNELVLEKETGFLIPDNDFVALAEQINWFLNNTEKAVAFGQAGKQKVLREFSLSQLTQNHTALYKYLLL